jgi:hypothetical protein
MCLYRGGDIGPKSKPGNKLSQLHKFFWQTTRIKVTSSGTKDDLGDGGGAGRERRKKKP